MNFLGHLYFSNNEPQLMVANLFGDFVKGRDLSKYPSLIQKGIILHREIDSYIDQHPTVLNLMHQLYETLPKISGIAVDLYFDHILAKKWNDYHTTNLDDFIQNFYNTEIDFPEYYTEEFLFMISKMKEMNWLHYYQFQEGLVKACDGLSRRISFENKLKEAPIVFQTKQKIIEECFELFMDDAIPHFKDFSTKIITQ